ncbi:hypothetical protein IMSHALPRED_003452 [Imshaugia aleurites]|uniref:Uncharacterized protein n=1 Tax=Imshaugia aleurites TaxID=172621 RepID=A0A8H3J7P1_9LECA|nr:hypothetical protein IMSHALPRED_003452 [Imshaugia aleurites]
MGRRELGERPGASGNRTNRLSDAEDSVIVRKRSLGRLRQGKVNRDFDDESAADTMDDAGGRWEDRLTRDGDDDDMKPARRPLRGGPPGRRGATSRDMDGLIGDMDLSPPQGRAGGRRPNFMDNTSDSVDMYSRGGRRGDPRITYTHDDRFDLQALQDQHAAISNELRDLIYNDNPRHEKRLEEVRYKKKCLEEDIARIKYVEAESSKTPRRTGRQMNNMDSNPRQSRAGGKKPRDTSGEKLDDGRNQLEFSDLMPLYQHRSDLISQHVRTVMSGDYRVAKAIEVEIEDATKAIDKLNRENPEEPRGSRSGHRGPAAGLGRASGR